MVTGVAFVCIKYVREIGPIARSFVLSFFISFFNLHSLLAYTLSLVGWPE